MKEDASGRREPTFKEFESGEDAHIYTGEYGMVS